MTCSDSCGGVGLGLHRHVCSVIWSMSLQAGRAPTLGCQLHKKYMRMYIHERLYKHSHAAGFLLLGHQWRCVPCCKVRCGQVQLSACLNYVTVGCFWMVESLTYRLPFQVPMGLVHEVRPVQLKPLIRGTSDSCHNSEARPVRLQPTGDMKLSTVCQNSGLHSFKRLALESTCLSENIQDQPESTIKDSLSTASRPVQSWPLC